MTHAHIGCALTIHADLVFAHHFICVWMVSFHAGSVWSIGSVACAERLRCGLHALPALTSLPFAVGAGRSERGWMVACVLGLDLLDLRRKATTNIRHPGRLCVETGGGELSHLSIKHRQTSRCERPADNSDTVIVTGWRRGPHAARRLIWTSLRSRRGDTKEQFGA